jgi:tRNA uridine 5-carboxymethylaminomethyl modification enzyme
VDAQRWDRFDRKRTALRALEAAAPRLRVEGTELTRWLKRSDCAYTGLPAEARRGYEDEIWEQFETNLKYEGYIVREQLAINKAEAGQAFPLPSGLDYTMLPGLRREARQKLGEVRPLTFGQAARISGITPADLAIVQIWLRKASLRGASAGMPETGASDQI